MSIFTFGLFSFGLFSVCNVLGGFKRGWNAQHMHKLSQSLAEQWILHAYKVFVSVLHQPLQIFMRKNAMTISKCEITYVEIYH